MQHTQRLSNETDPEKMGTVLFSTEAKFKWNGIRIPMPEGSFLITTIY